MGRRIAIVGAGVSGLAAAWALRGSGAEVILFEKSRGLAGRAASRTRAGVRFDHGANYFKAPPGPVADLVLEQLPSDDLVRIEGEIWTFDAHGALGRGDPALNAEPKWTYRSGISTLGKQLAAAARAEVRRQVRIERLIERGGRWRAADGAGATHGPFDAVLLTAPAPQTRELLARSTLPPVGADALADALGAATYHRQFSVVLAVEGELERPGDFFALVNSDRRHELAWLSFENDKPGRVPAGQTVLIAQLSPAASDALFDAGRKHVAEFAAAAAGRLLRCSLPLRWADVQRWRFAHPGAAADPGALAAAAPPGLFFAGDALAGRGRVAAALETGLEAARQIAAQLDLVTAGGTETQ